MWSEVVGRPDLIPVMEREHTAGQDLEPVLFVSKELGFVRTSQFHLNRHVRKSVMQSASDGGLQDNLGLVNPPRTGNARSLRTAGIVVWIGSNLQPTLRRQHSYQRAVTRAVDDYNLKQAIIEEPIYGLIAELVLAIWPVNCESHTWSLP